MIGAIRRLDLTEGQIYTTAIGLSLAILLAVAGLPAVLRARTLPARASANPLTGRAPSANAAATEAANPATGASPGGGGGAPSPAHAPIGVPGASGPPPTIALPADGLPLLSITTFAFVGSPGAPGGLAVGRNGTIYVTTDNGTAHGDAGASHVFSYDAHGSRIGDRVIEGQPDGHVNGLTGAAVDPISGAVAVLQPDAPRILSIGEPPDGQRLLAEIPDLPACLVSLGADPCQQGAEDRTPFPTSAAFDALGNLFVADPAQDTIWRLRPGAQLPEVWFQSPYFTIGDGPFGLVVDDASIEFTVGTTLDPAAPTAGGLYRVAVKPDGAAGPLTLVSVFGRGDEPGPLTVGSSGTAYVVLRSTGAILAITPAGAESWRITPPGSGPIPLDAPSALALIQGQLLVANKGSGPDPAHWAVLAVTVNEGPRQ
jgi:hypothetical protein